MHKTLRSRQQVRIVMMLSVLMRIKQRRKDLMEVEDVPPLPTMPDRQDFQRIEAGLDQVQQHHDAVIIECAAASKKSALIFTAKFAAVEERMAVVLSNGALG